MTQTFDEDLIGTDGDDTQTAPQSGNYAIYGYGGNDAQTGGDGNDLLDGGTGDDLMIGGAGDDTIVGGDGVVLHFFPALVHAGPEARGGQGAHLWRHCRSCEDHIQ